MARECQVHSKASAKTMLKVLGERVTVGEDMGGWNRWNSAGFARNRTALLITGSYQIVVISNCLKAGSSVSRGSDSISACAANILSNGSRCAA